VETYSFADGSDLLGTIGMEDTKDSPFGLIGVAPEATLGM